MISEDLKTDPDKSCEQLELLTTVLQEFSTSLDIDTTLQHVTNLVKQYLEAEGVSLFLLEDDNRVLVCRVCASSWDITGEKLSSNEGIVGRALREGKTQLVQDANTDPDFYQGVDEHSGAVTKSILCAPMLLKDCQIGVLEAINKKNETGQFDEHDKNLLTILANTAAMAIHNAQMADELVFQERTRRELELAREIQAALLPDNTTDYDIYGVNIPARMVSGDFYDHFRREDGRVCFSLGDVSGKSINASLLMAKTTSLFRCLGKRLNSPGELLAIINNELYANSTHGMFVTMVAGVYDPKTHDITMVNAGHQPPLQVMESGEIISPEAGSIPLGIMPDVVFEEYHINIAGSDLYLFTDGLTECWFQRDQQLGDEGVRDIIRKFSDIIPSDRLHAIVRSATKWKREHTGYLYDDVTVMLISSDGKRVARI